MEQRMSAWEARRQFGKVLKDVTREGTAFIVESHGEEVAAIVPMRNYRMMQRQFQNLHDQLKSISESVNLSEDEAMQLALDAVAEVRAARKRVLR